LEVSLAGQTQGFLYACILGLFLGALYDVFRVLRVFLHFDRRPVFFQDLFCCCAAAVATFLLALMVNWGEVRFYLLAGEIIGVCVYFLTVGEVTIRLAKVIYRVLSCVWNFFRRHLFRPVKNFLKRIFLFVSGKALNLKKSLKKRPEKQKTP
jgi:spore cortex biosynthesis protein YabQ